MTIDLPEYLKSGERARLIPVAPSGQKERQATSVLLATMSIVPTFCRDVLDTIGKRVGARTRIYSFTEVVFKRTINDSQIRPDGLLIVDTGRAKWSALIEAKIGSASINPSQIAQYIELARENDIDAVISISNELTTLPDHPPYEVPSRSNGRVAIFHWSWMRLVTIATLLISGDEPFEKEQHYILKEMLRYFTHENIGIRGVHRMNTQWKPLMERIHAGGRLHKDEEEVLETVRCWHQEVQDVCLLLSRKLKVPVSLDLRRTHKDNQASRISEDADQLAETKRLTATFNVPEVAGPIEVVAHALRRNIICRMRVDAPRDLKRYSSRLNWLLRQLPSEVDQTAAIRIRWQGGGETFAQLAELKENPEVAEIGRPGALPRSFEITIVKDLERKFFGPSSFVVGLETAIPTFYDEIARHIEAWQPSPPSGPAGSGDETLSDEIESLPEAQLGPRRIVQRGDIAGRAFTIFDDGSIEVETNQGVKWFKDLAALQSFANTDL